MCIRDRLVDELSNWSDRQVTKIESSSTIEHNVNVAQQLAEAGVIDGIARVLEAELQADDSHPQQLPHGDSDDI